MIQLWEQLDLKIKEQQARQSGLCAIRRALYSQCFGEIREGVGVTSTVFVLFP